MTYDCELTFSWASAIEKIDMVELSLLFVSYWVQLFSVCA
jgi:hypothetical protein